MPVSEVVDVAKWAFDNNLGNLMLQVGQGTGAGGERGGQGASGVRQHLPAGPAPSVDAAAVPAAQPPTCRPAF